MSDRLPEEDGELKLVPEFVRKAMYQVQGGKWYLPAAARIMWFREDRDAADWGIETMLLEGGQEAGFCTVSATIRNTEGRIIAQAMKTETRQDFPAGWVEKAETGAISRALAVAGWGTQFAIKELEEGRLADSPQGNGDRTGSTASQAVERGHLAVDGRSMGPNHPSKAAAPNMAGQVWEGPGQCPRCHAPEGKRHGKQCIG